MKHLILTFFLAATTATLIAAEDTMPIEPMYQLTQEAPLTELDDEISFLEDEFDTEIIAIKDAITTSADALIVEVPPAETAIEQIPVDAPVVATLNVEAPTFIGEPAHISSSGIQVDFKQAFSGSPIIYSVLIGMSLVSVSLWLYALASIRVTTRVSNTLVRHIQNQLGSNNFHEAIELCRQNNSLLSKMMITGIETRRHGLPMVIESMKAEAKRSTVFFWQKLSLLNDIAIIAPMLGLLGTVLGMFYAFYDVNRSIESISTLFDGLGISVGTTVAGLIVAIIALILHSTAKYRLVRGLAKVENQAQSMVILLDDKSHIHRG